MIYDFWWDSGGRSSHFLAEISAPKDVVERMAQEYNERQHEKALWEEEHGSCMTCDYDNNPNPLGSCNCCINSGGKLDLYKRKQKKRKRRRIG